ncbi:MAG: signal peptidase II [Magnetococcales bacterium]|nr:signal peptidase II [Magnetococcales bacterium]
MKGQLLYGGLLAAGVALVDQLTKLWAVEALAHRTVTIVTGFFDLELVHNLGAAFGLFSSWPELWRHALLIGVAVVATAVITRLLWQSSSRLEATTLALVLGGAIGNLIDRLRLGWVIDFIHWHWYQWSWPVFNIADSAITVGIALLLWQQFRRPPSTS